MSRKVNGFFFSLYFISTPSFLNSNGLFSASLYAGVGSIMTEHRSRQTVCRRAGSAKRKSVWYAEPVTDPWKAIASCGEIKHMIFESRDTVNFTYVRAWCPSKRLFWSRHLTPEIIPSSVFRLDIPFMLCTVCLNCKSFSYSLFSSDPTMQVF